MEVGDVIKSSLQQILTVNVKIGKRKTQGQMLRLVRVVASVKFA